MSLALDRQDRHPPQSIARSQLLRVLVRVRALDNNHATDFRFVSRLQYPDAAKCSVSTNFALSARGHDHCEWFGRDINAANFKFRWCCNTEDCPSRAVVDFPLP